MTGAQKCVKLILAGYLRMLLTEKPDTLEPITRLLVVTESNSVRNSVMMAIKSVASVVLHRAMTSQGGLRSSTQTRTQVWSTPPMLPCVETKSNKPLRNAMTETSTTTTDAQKSAKLSKDGLLSSKWIRPLPYYTQWVSPFVVMGS